MIRTFILCILMFHFVKGSAQDESKDYAQYHRSINEIEILLSQEAFEKALTGYEEIFSQYEFVFIRDIQIAAQVAGYTGRFELAFELIRKGMEAGWKPEDIKKTDSFKSFQDHPAWSDLEESEELLQERYQDKVDWELRHKIREMFKQDQKKAMGALLRIGDKAREKYAVKKFAPHSELQMFELIGILEEKGYPGEQLTANDFWMSTIISHHNSISKTYSKKDTLFSFVRPKLKRAVEQGQMSPYEYALADDWRIAVISERSQAGYGYINPPKSDSLDLTNALRQEIGLRTVELRNKLVEIELKTGLDFYLPNWVKGKIRVEQIEKN